MLPPRRPSTACRHAVSGSVSLPSQGCFSPFPHGTGSLSVTSEYLALPDGPGRFTQDFSCPALLRSHTQSQQGHVADRAVTFSGRPFQTVRLCPCAVLCGLSRPNALEPVPAVQQAPVQGRGTEVSGPTTPVSVARHWFGLFRVRSPLLAESLFCFLFLQVLRWFTSLGWLLLPMNSATDQSGLPDRGSPIRTSPGHRLCAPRRSVSPLTASFVACWCRGIPAHALKSLTGGINAGLLARPASGHLLSVQARPPWDVRCGCILEFAVRHFTVGAPLWLTLVFCAQNTLDCDSVVKDTLKRPGAEAPGLPLLP